MDKLTITLAGTDYEIKELTLGQIEDMQEVLLPPPSVVSDGKTSDRRILAIALREEHPDLTFEVLSKMRIGSARKLNETVRGILVFGGFMRLDEPKKGEGTQPGEAPAGAA